MISADTNIFIHYFRGIQDRSTSILKESLDNMQLILNPFVLSELLSSPKMPQKTEKYLLDLPKIEIQPEFFKRAGLLRREIYQKGKGVTMADIYIAQSCIDANVPLLSLDQDMLTIADNSDLKTIKIA